MSAKRLSQEGKRAAWGPPCQFRKMQRYILGQGEVLIRPEAFAALVLLSSILRHHGVTPRAHDTWSYHCRKIGGTSLWSMHAYGIALDIRATSYPLGVPVTDPAMLAAAARIEALTTPDGWTVWDWGGRWRRPDGMHFELACPIASAKLLRY